MFHGPDENHTVPPESEVLLSAVFSFPVPWHRLSRGGWGVWSLCSWNTPSSPPSWREWPPPRSAIPEVLSPTTTRCCRDVSAKTVPQHPETWGNQGGSHPLPVPCHRRVSWLPRDLSPGDGRGHLRAPSLCFLNGRRDGGIEEILEVFLPPSDDIPSWGQQPPTSTVNSVGGALLPPPEAPDALPESLWGQPVVLLHGLTELLPGLSFCLHNHRLGGDYCSCTPLSLPVPVSCLRSPTSQPGPIGLLLQLDGIPYFRCPPPGSGIAASTGTRDLMATAQRGRVDNGGGEHGPLWLNISNLPRDPVEAPPEVGVEDLSDRGFCQTFPEDPYSMLGSAESVQLPPPPLDPTHHQVVISWQLHPSLHLSVQDIRPKVRWNDHKVNHRPTA